MPKNSAAQEKKVNAAVRFLQTTIGVKVPQAMNLAGLSKSRFDEDIR
jgi:ribosomal protein L5